LHYKAAMNTISKRELNQQTAHVLAQVSANQPLLITERGIARWRIEAIDAGRDAIARLRHAGRIVAAKQQPQPWPADKACYTPAQVDALFAELRGEH
jgi:antitoxin (DNA-binding transcriptional repressor) of toxin-antitoxin stability system